MQHLDCLDDHEKAVFKTAFEIDQRWLVEHAADRAPYICQSQSLNIFLPADVHKRDLHQIHMMAWKRGVKSLYYCRSLSHPARRNRRRRGAHRRTARRPCSFSAQTRRPSPVPPSARRRHRLSRTTTKSALAASNVSRPRRAHGSIRPGRDGVSFASLFFRFIEFERSAAMSLLDAKPIYKPFHYPWAYDAWLMQQRIHWLPEEVPLADDVKDWRNKLTDSERHLLTQIFRFFTQADVEVNNCYMRHYSRVFKPTEVQMMLAAFSSTETIHVAAYSHLLDTIGMPETEYSAFLHVKEMKDKYDYMQEFNVDLEADDRQDAGGVRRLHRGPAALRLASPC